MVNIVTQKMTIEAVSDDLSCEEITKRLNSVGIFTSFLDVKPLNNREDLINIAGSLERLEKEIHSIASHLKPLGG